MKVQNYIFFVIETKIIIRLLFFYVFAVREHDQKIIGMIDIRHNLENDFWAEYGGHLGYSVRPSERRKGYATEIMKMGLEYAKSLGIE